MFAAVWVVVVGATTGATTGTVDDDAASVDDDAGSVLTTFVAGRA